MKNGILSARLGPDYLIMVEKLRLTGESDSDFLRRAIDALAVSDAEFTEFVQGELGKEDY